MSEWLKEQAWKACIWVTVSWVRIPSPLQRKAETKVSAFLFLQNELKVYFHNRFGEIKNVALQKSLAFLCVFISFRDERS